MRIKRILIGIIILLIVSVALSIYFGLSGTPWGKMQQKKSMLTYLEDKYQMEFTIHKVHYNALGTGYFATASPKSNPMVTFELSVSADELAKYADLYPVEFWKTDDAEPFKSYLAQLFPGAIIGLDRKLEEDVGPNIPILQTMHYDMSYSGVLTIHLKSDWFEKTEDEQKTELDKIHQLSSYLQKKHFPVLVLIYYETDDYVHRKAIYITQEGKIVGSSS